MAGIAGEGYGVRGEVGGEEGKRLGGDRGEERGKR